MPRASCSVFAFEVAGSTVRTVEGLAGDGELSPVQAAFADNSAFQCGYCTAGMILLTEALLARESGSGRRDDQRLDQLQHLPLYRLFSLILEAVRDAARRKRETAS